MRISPNRTVPAAVLGLAALLGCASTQAVTLPQNPAIAGAVGGPGATFNYGGSTLTVNQSASRVVIDWQSFSIGAGGAVNFVQSSPAAIAFNRVTVNPATGLSPLSTLAGTLTAQGGVWLFSTGGILFGAGSVVNVGSFAGITAPLGAVGGTTQLLFASAGGQTTVNLDPPIGSGVEDITVQNGARVNANAGYVVLQGETLSQNGQITATDGVEYLVSEAGQILFTTSATGQQLQGANPLIVAGQDAPSFTHAGSSTGAWIGIDTPGGALKSGYHGVINLGGVVDATGIKPGGGGAGVVLLVGEAAGPAAPGYNGSTIGLDASGGSIIAANGLTVTTDNAKLGAVGIGGPLNVSTYGALTAAQPETVAGSVTLISATGPLALNAGVSANGAVLGVGGSVAVAPGVVVRSDALGAGHGGLVLSSQGDVLADATSSLLAGAAGGAPTDNVTVRAGLGTGGGNITLGQISSVQAFVQSHSAGFATEGAITLNGPITGSRAITVLVGDVTTVGSAGGDLRVQGAVTSSGFIDLENLGVGALTVGSGSGVTSSGGQVFLYAGGNSSVLNGATVSGTSLLDHTTGTLTVAAGGVVKTTGATAAPVAPTIPFGSDTKRASGLNLAASALVVQGTVTAGSKTAPDDIYIEVLAPAGATATIGGPAGPGFTLSNASFNNLSARDVIVMGGPGESISAGANLSVQALTLDSTKIAALWLGASSTRSIAVGGAVTTANGPVDLRLGFARQGAGVSSLDGFIPGEIDVTGALGTSGEPLGAVDLIARNNVFIGNAGFVAAASANPGFDAFTQSALFPNPQPGVVQVAANSLQIAAQGRVIQQNTGANSLIFSGVIVGAPTAATPLIYVPTALQGVSIGGAYTANFAAGPARVDLFGTVNTIAGPNNLATAAQTPYLLDTRIASAANDRINGCAFGTNCTALTSPVALTFQGPTAESIAAVTASTTSSVAATVTTTTVPDVITFLTPAAITLRQDDDRLGGVNPITETGNGDLSFGATSGCPVTLDTHGGCPTP